MAIEPDKTLSDLPADGQGAVTTLQGGKDFVSRMATMGFTFGAPVTMVRNNGRGPVIVLVRGTRVALGRGEARKVTVRESPNNGGS